MQRGVGPSAAIALVSALVCICGFGCAATQRTTLLRGSDIQLSTQRIIDQLAASEWLAGRSATSPRAVLRPERLENLSDNRLSQGDQWAAMSMVLLNPRMLEMLRSKNVIVQMPTLRSDAIARAGLTINEPAAQLTPTHLFRGRLRSLSRAGGGASVDSDGVERRDTFIFEYAIADVETREIKWSGQTEFSRLAHGSLID